MQLDSRHVTTLALAFPPGQVFATLSPKGRGDLAPSPFQEGET